MPDTKVSHIDSHFDRKNKLNSNVWILKLIGNHTQFRRVSLITNISCYSEIAHNGFECESRSGNVPADSKSDNWHYNNNIQMANHLLLSRNNSMEQ